MEARNNAGGITSKEKHGVFSYSIKGILGLNSDSDSVKDQDSGNTKDEIECEGNQTLKTFHITSC